MPTIEVNYNDLQELVGTHVPLDKLQEEGIMFAKGEVDEIDGEILKLDMKDTNRPDLWSAEGIARELQGRYGEAKGVPRYKTKKSDLRVIVDPGMKSIRPYTVCAVVKDLHITPDVLSQMIQLQEKLSITFGRNRSEVAVGAYDYHKIKPPIRFMPVAPDGLRFAPLGFSEEMTPAKILKKHPKGLEYGHLLKGMKKYPIFIDADDNVLSMPPIINSDHTGKVTTSTRDIFIESSGFDLKFQLPALNVLVSALADRGGTVETVEVSYPDRKLVTPDMNPRKTSVNADYANSVTGLGLTVKEMCSLLEKARYTAAPKGKKIDLLYPCYRQDIMHQRDVIEDILISYGFNSIKPSPPGIVTRGGMSGMARLSEAAAESMIGLGFQEIMSYILTNKDHLFRRMNTGEADVVEIENRVSANWYVFRNWMLPSLLDFLSRNRHREYPQMIFETGETVLPDREAETRSVSPVKLAAAVSAHSVGYEKITSVLDAFLSGFGVKYSLETSGHGSFIKGRRADVVSGKAVLGTVGEIHPVVLNNWELENPVAAFELDLGKLMKILEK